jgi:hypothetical protein
MRLHKIHEDKKGPVRHDTPHAYLYHLTDHHGFAYSVANNALNTLRHGYVSTTYDKTNNSIVGGNHYDFKFILNGPALASTYGVFDYDAYTTLIGVGGSRKRASLNEREIGINTRSVSPLRSFCEGVVLLFPMFSQRGIQWLMYQNRDTKPFMDTPKSAAPRAISALDVFVREWKLPVLTGPSHRHLDEREQSFLARVLDIHNSGADYQKAMRDLVDEYPVTDHFGEDLDGDIVRRLQMGDKLTKMFNAYFQNRRAPDVKPDKVRALVRKAMEMLGLNSNIIATIMARAEERDMFHPVMPVVEWSIVFGDLMYGDVEGALESINYTSKRNAWGRERYDAESDERMYHVHAGTMFSSMANR